ncbi:ATP-binding protein [Actinoallomurus sp. NBC_01490]|uniref:ATP-binding protein n=1 Tax=Actinoallomurus sp. NBC_01490 TaxID=2903557 RepID=UPI002E32C74B|nr:ATP-binding protein [Actinoallomurus sp. NBC_01490]
MPEFQVPTTDIAQWDGPRHGRPAAQPSMRLFHWGVCVTPAIVMAAVAFGAVFLQAAMAPSVKSAGIAMLVAVAGVVILVVAGGGAEAAHRRVRQDRDELVSAHASAQQELALGHEKAQAELHGRLRQLHARIDELRALAAHGRDDVEQLAKRLMSGERIAPYSAGDLRFTGGDSVVLLAHDLEALRAAALRAVIQVAQQIEQSRAAHAVQVYATLALRMQSRANRAIRMLDELERRVVDPDMLKRLFAVDHQVTINRRQAENFAVICGEASRRRWSDPQPISKVLRAAVVEVEDYPRVRVATKIQGALEGDGVSDVVHLVAELIENATSFSKPDTHVLVRTRGRDDGVVIEVVDEGLGMPPGDVERWNAYLANPPHPSVITSHDRSHIGLAVVAALASRQGIRVSLRSELHRGTTAYVELPARMVQVADRRSRSAAHPPPEAALPPAPPEATDQPTPRPVVHPPHPIAGVGHQHRGEQKSVIGGDQGSAYLRPGGPTAPSTPPPSRSGSETASAQRAGHRWQPPPSAAPDGEQPPATTRRPLPQRVPQQSFPEQRHDGANRRSEDSDTEPTPDLIADFKKGAGDLDDESHDRL